MNVGKFALLGWIAAVGLGIWPAGAADPEPLLPTAETPAQRDARLAWWREARFGLFIHWGPSSVSGKEISWARIGHPHDHRGLESVPPEEYDNLYQQFNPVKFDADAWMRLAKDAGMKYVVFITKHHDGFSMWPTKLRPDYSIAATPFRRDICREIADAAHQHGLKLGWYYSTRDWTHPDYLVGDNRKYDDVLPGPGARAALQLRPRRPAVVRSRGRQLARLPVPGTVRDDLPVAARHPGQQPRGRLHPRDRGPADPGVGAGWSAAISTRRSSGSARSRTTARGNRASP